MLGRAWAVAALTLALAGGPALAAGSLGETVFQQCIACHSVDPADHGLPAPSLAGVVGRSAGSVANFDYSPAMQAAGRAGLTWSEAELDRFLTDPSAKVPNTWMDFAGLSDPADRAAVIAFLKARPAL